MFALFAGETHYPKEGFRDFVCKSDSIEYLTSVSEVMEELNDKFYLFMEWWQIVDLETCKIIKKG